MTTYTDYPFTSNGVNFISRIYSESPFLPTVQRIGAEKFAELNIMAVQELLGDASLMTKAEILAKLETLNENGTHAFILLGANA